MPLSVDVERGIEVPDESIVTDLVLRGLGLPKITLNGKIGAGSILLTEGIVHTQHLQTDSVETDEFDTKSVHSDQLGQGAVTGDKLAPGVVTADKSTPGPYWSGAGILTGGVYVITLVPPAPAYVPGMKVTFLPNAANLGPCDVNVDGLGAVNLLKSAGQELTASDLRWNKPAVMIYSGVALAFILVSEPANAHPLPFGTTSGTSSEFTLDLTARGFPPLHNLYTGARVLAFFNATCAANPTLAVDSLAPKQIRHGHDAALAATNILIGDVFQLVYDTGANSGAGAWLVNVSHPIRKSSGLLTITRPDSLGALVKYEHGLGRVPHKVEARLVRIASGWDVNFPEESFFPIKQGDELPLTMLGQCPWIIGGNAYFPNRPAFEVSVDATHITIMRLLYATYYYDLQQNLLQESISPPWATSWGPLNTWRRISGFNPNGVTTPSLEEQYAYKLYFE